MNVLATVRPPVRLQHALDLFGYASLKPEQNELIEASIGGRDVMAVLPTGYGKSAIYHIPGIATGAKTLVVSPLIALQEDQVQILRRVGVKAFALHSNLPQFKKDAALYYFRVAKPNEPAFLYLSPEYLLTDAFFEQFQNIRFDRIAIDEAHCVSTWGSTFRPEYQRIKMASERLGIPHCAACTATTDPRIDRDIQERLPLRPGHLRIEGDPTRPNLELHVENIPIDHSRIGTGFLRTKRLWDLLGDPERAGPAIIYCGTRSAAYHVFKRVAAARGFLREHNYTAYLFHAHLPIEDKLATLRGFKLDQRPVICATSAFGMGVDREDIRQVIHYSEPYTLIDYAQQFGRAGRDGHTSWCTTFFSKAEFLAREVQRVRFDMPSITTVEKLHRSLYNRLSKLPPANRRTYNVRKFERLIEQSVQANDKIKSKESYLSRVMSAIAILRQEKVIMEDASGLIVRDIVPGTGTHQNLIERTKMRERMEVREKERINEFFNESTPEQSRLWQLLRQD